jgi:hypothetical protein
MTQYTGINYDQYGEQLKRLNEGLRWGWKNCIERMQCLESLKKFVAKSTVQGYVKVKGPDTRYADQSIKDDLSFLYEELRTQYRKSIHIDFDLLDTAAERGRPELTIVARAILHEASHKFAGSADFAASDWAAYQTISPAQAVNNADSLAWVCVCLNDKTCYQGFQDVLRKGN